MEAVEIHGFQLINSASDDDNDEPLPKKLCELLCMPQDASECALAYLNLSDPPRMNCCRAGLVFYFS